MELTCPKCQGSMRTHQRSGITVDQCTECRGIWLDRGELERLVDAETAFHSSDRAISELTPPPSPPVGAARPRGGWGDEDDAYRDGRYRENRYDDHYAPRRTKRKSFLEELFD